MTEFPVITRVRLYRDSAGEFRFTAYTPNNRAIVASTEGYTNRADAYNAAAALFPTADLDVEDDG